MAYLSLSTANLPDPAEAIDPAQDGSPTDHFNTVLYTGNGTARSITGVGFSPDWLWFKARNHAHNPEVYDIVRGTQKGLMPSTTNPEFTRGVTSFDSDGFSLDTSIYTNQTDKTFVTWCWNGGGTGVSNSDGSITSTVSANTDSGFSIVSYTGTGANATVGHGLDKAPEMMIIKNRDREEGWPVYHTGLTSAVYYMQLDITAGESSGSTAWNSTHPTSTVFSIGTWAALNANNEDHIAYCFHSVEGYSKIGKYTGNGSADGPFVYTGFRPAFVLWKRTDATQEWHMMDVERNTYNPLGKDLWPPHSSAEYDYGTVVDYTSNGFKLRTNSVIANTSGGTYVYMAFAENPFKYSNAR